MGIDPPLGRNRTEILFNDTNAASNYLRRGSFKTMYIAFAILFIVASIALQLLVSGPRQFRKRSQWLTEYTTRKGYRLVNPAVARITDFSSTREILSDPSLKSLTKGSDGIGDIEGLERGTDDPFVFACSLHSKEAMIFELSVSSQRSDGRESALPYRVAKIAMEGAPRFSLSWHSALDTVINVVEKMAGKSVPTIDVDPQLFPQFAKNYCLRGPDACAVLSFLSAGKISFLQNRKLAGTIATNSRYFVYFESGRLRSEPDCDAFIATVDDLAANLL